MPDDDLIVVDEPTKRRYALYRDGELLSFATYSIDGNSVTVPHVETLRRHRGNGYADELMAGLLERLRDDGRTIRPICPFAAGYIRARPDTHDLVAR